MLIKRLSSLFGSANDRLLKKFSPYLTQCNDFAEKIAPLKDAELQNQTALFKQRIANGESLDSLLPEAYATVREAALRTIGLKHFDVQIIGAIALHNGYIAEMKTGEGKTLAATPAVYLNALSGEGAHVVTVNDYLASRDAEWMGEIYKFLNLSVGTISPNQADPDRRAAYAADITYATNNELGFDYLRDNLKIRTADIVQRGFNFAVIDEVDSILIDEARTPLVISGPSETASGNYVKVDKLIPLLDNTDYELDEKSRSVNLVDQGTEKIENLLREKTDLLEEGGGLYDIKNISLLHHIEQALKAHKLFAKDKDYMVQDDQVMIIDEFTGRAMAGRRYSEGLHQALEAKENLAIQTENQTLASVTFQNYFRMYPKLSGMTGTASTEAEEFESIYNLPVVELPSHKPMVRIDHEDDIYRTATERDHAFLQQVKECVSRQQPVLVGSASIEHSEKLSDLLKKEKIAHKVLNARQNAEEAETIACAGEPMAVTIATNMAGRGTDIQLGGNLQMRLAKAAEGSEDEVKAKHAKDKEIVLAAGGLYVLGTERHESRRIDNQLRGRSGRQGDVGASKFFVSLEDDLMRIFGSETMDKILSKLGMQDGEAISHPWISKALEKAQQKVEQRNFEMRKQLLKFDDVMNDQRKVIFEQRQELMLADDISATVREMRLEFITSLVAESVPHRAMREDWRWDYLAEESRRVLNFAIPPSWRDEDGLDASLLEERLVAESDKLLALKEVSFGVDLLRDAEKLLVLQILDHLWKDHLLQLDHLRQGIGLRAYGQRDPLNEYKQESFVLFEDLLVRLGGMVTQVMSFVELDAVRGVEREREDVVEDRSVLEVQKVAGKVRRNDLCPCGSGKKYKHCHGKI